MGDLRRLIGADDQVMFWSAVGDLLPSALGVALSPVPIVAVILILGTPKAESDGVAFAAGWFVALAVVSAVVVALSSGSDTSSSESTAVDVIKLILGLFMLLIAVKQWRGRPKEGEEAALPAWMDAIDEMGPGKAGGMGALLAGANPKNLALTLAAAGSIGEAGLSTGANVGAVAVFVVLGSVSVVGPVAAFLLMGKKVEHPLAEAKQFMAQHNAAIMTVVCLLLGVKLVGAGIAGVAN